MEQESEASSSRASPTAARKDNHQANSTQNERACPHNASQAVSGESGSQESTLSPGSRLGAFDNEDDAIEMDFERNDFNDPPSRLAPGDQNNQVPDPGSLDNLARNEVEEDKEEEPANAYSHIEDEFIQALCDADINNGDLSAESVERLLNPPEYPLELDEEVNANLIECLGLFLNGHNSAKHYNQTICNLKRQHPEEDLLSFNQLKQTIRELTGIVPIINDICGKFQMDPTTGKPRLQLYTIPLGFSIQALKRQVKTAEQMQYFWKQSQELLKELRENQEIELIDDIVCGTDVLCAVERGDIRKEDTVLMFSFDGAQIY
ncbi:hypothetical protein H0H93_007840 [Arthromyces matolae]|nr:hypothetical protein H0H93_007840 [Arthromyces matolae]